LLPQLANKRELVRENRHASLLIFGYDVQKINDTPINKLHLIFKCFDTFRPYLEECKQLGNVSTEKLELALEHAELIEKAYPAGKRVEQFNYFSRETFQKMEKCEIHAHLSGSIALPVLQQIAQEQGKLQAYQRLLQEKELLSQRVKYEDCFRFFLPIEEILGVNKPCETDEEALIVCDNIIRGVVSVCEQYAADNVKWLELRTSLKRIKQGAGFEPYLDAVLEGIRQSEKAFGMKVHLLLSIRRRTSEADCAETLKLAIAHKYPQGKVVGMDLSGSSVEGDGKAAINCLQQAQKEELETAMHIGESPKELAKQQRKEMKKLMPKRIGHAVNIHDREILKDTLLEFCPSSAYYTTMHENAEDHPAYEDIRRKKRPVTIGCDDITMFPLKNLTEEFYRVAKYLNLSLQEVYEMVMLAKQRRFKYYFSK
jgi:adenosine deaminase